MEGRGIREKARNTSGRDEEKTKGEDKKMPGRMGERKGIQGRRNVINLKRCREREKRNMVGEREKEEEKGW